MQEKSTVFSYDHSVTSKGAREGPRCRSQYSKLWTTIWRLAPSWKTQPIEGYSHSDCQMQDHSSPQEVLMVAEMCQQKCLLDSRPLRFYGDLKFHKEGFPLGNTELQSAIQVSNRCDVPFVGNLLHHKFVQCRTAYEWDREHYQQLPYIFSVHLNGH